MKVEVTAWEWQWEGKIASVEAEVRGPGGFRRELALAPTNPIHYEFEGLIELPSTSPIGIYSVTAVTAVDERGETVRVDQAGFEETDGEEERLRYGSWHELIVYEGPDHAAPELTGLTISPSELDTSAGPQSARTTIGAVDPVSGIAEVSGTFEMPNGDYWTGAHRLEGTALSGKWVSKIDLPRYAPPGPWHLTELRLEDRAGNHATFSAAEIEARGFPTGFVQVGTGDITPPSVLGISISPSVLHASRGDGIVHFYLHLADDLAGINSDANCGGWVELQSVAEPSFRQVATPPIPVSGTDRDGIFQVSTFLSPSSPLGSYKVTEIETCDRAFNVVRLDGAALEAMGWELIVENLP